MNWTKLNMRKLSIRLLFIFELILYVRCENIFATTATAGNIKGKIKNVNGKNYGVFLGIPYAKPPLGDLRFKEPQPLDSISGTSVVDASNDFSKMCMQGTPVYPSSVQSEDCLYLNVLSPLTENLNNSKLPIMVWIHGGAFVVGSASEYPVEGTLRNIVSRGVVFVSINYRLAIFGFFSTKSAVAPGNYGLLDQVEALRWVQNNIQFFGGDPSQVTIFGESAGGASVSFLTISPLAKDLFNQAIMMSGSALAHWAIMYDSDPNDVFGNILIALGCRSNITKPTNVVCPYRNNAPEWSSDELKQHETETKCLRSKSVSEISSKSVTLMMPPRVDGKFLPDLPEKLIKKRHRYNLMIGATKDEYALFAFFDESNFLKTEEDFHKNAASVQCSSFKYPKLINLTVNKHYSSYDFPSTSELKNEKFWFQQSVKRETSLWFIVPAYKDAVEAVNTNSKVYMYSWDYHNAMQLIKEKINFTWTGAPHTSELFSLFDTQRVSIIQQDYPGSTRDKSQDKKSSEVMGKLFTNFAKFGNPTPDNSMDGVTWDSFTKKDSNYLSIDMPKIKMVNNYYKDDVDFWTKFVPSIEESVSC